MNRFKYLMILFVFFLFFLPLTALADMDEILLNQETMSHKHQRSEVLFPHELHMECLECLDCHHDYKGGENVLDEDDLYEDNPNTRCNACHTPDTSMDATEAFHHQCMGCHINAIKDKTKSRGHEMCGSCHVNKDS
jgi:hypothetical protein